MKERTSGNRGESHRKHNFFEVFKEFSYAKLVKKIWITTIKKNELRNISIAIWRDLMGEYCNYVIYYSTRVN